MELPALSTYMYLHRVYPWWEFLEKHSVMTLIMATVWTKKTYAAEYATLSGFKPAKNTTIALRLSI